LVWPTLSNVRKQPAIKIREARIHEPALALWTTNPVAGGDFYGLDGWLFRIKYGSSDWTAAALAFPKDQRSAG
jgi:hypothetical protein